METATRPGTPLRHRMFDASELASLQRTETKLLAYGPFLERLREQGRERGAVWLADKAAGVGRHSTVDVHRHFG